MSDLTLLDMDEDEYQNAREREAHKARQHADDWRWLLSSAAGRRIAWALLQASGVFEAAASVEGPWAAFHEGRRRLGLAVLSRQHDSPDDYALMLRENVNV